jgi:hypothetical protein
MTRPPWEVADVIRIAGSRFQERYGASFARPGSPSANKNCCR